MTGGGVLVRLLGPVRAGVDDGSAVEPPGLVPAAVLAHLALASGRVVTPDVLAAAVWDVPPDHATNALQAAVSRLRGTYGAGLIESSRVGYRLRVDDVDVEHVRVAEAAARAAQVEGDDAEASRQLDIALSWFRGEPLGRLGSTASAAARASLLGIRSRLATARVEVLLSLGEPGVAIGAARDELAGNPYDEHLAALLLRALSAAGRPAEALTEFDVTRRRLAADLGTDPSHELRDTVAAILAGTRPPAASRRHVTVSAPRDVALLLSEIEVPSEFWRRRAEEITEVMLLHRATVAEAVRGHGGVLFPQQGEAGSLIATFEQAGSAVESAAALQRALAQVDRSGDLRPVARVAVVFGTVVEADGAVFGSTVHLGLRLRSLAHGGQVLLNRAVAERAMPAPGWSTTSLGRVTVPDMGDIEVVQLDLSDQPSAFPDLVRAARLPAEVAGFVGRQVEVRDVCDALATHRLVTVTGLGGAGKTALAIRVASSSIDEFPRGVTFVDLSASSSAEDVIAAVAIAVGGPGSTSVEDVVRALGPGRTLLVLDDLEGVDGGAGAVRQLVDASGASVLATSRDRLGLAGELVRPLAALSDPDALELLRARAREVAPGLELDAVECRELLALAGGSPLAIELMAGRLRLMPVRDLIEAVSSTTEVLTDTSSGRPLRHRAIGALLTDAWTQLDAVSRRLLMALAVVRSDVSAVDAADLSGTALVTCLTALDGLVTRGLTREIRHVDAGPRFSVVELIRRFVLGAGEVDTLAQVQRAHVRWTARAVERPGVVASLRDDLRSALVTSADPAAAPAADDRIRLARAALALGWWDDVIDQLDAVEHRGESANPLGVALLRRDAPGDRDRGRTLLERAAAAGDADAAAALGGSFKTEDPGRALAWYLAALEIDPSDPYALGNVVEQEIVVAGGGGPESARRDAVVSARDRRAAQVGRAEDLPWSAFDLAKLSFWLGEPTTGMHALLDGVQSSTHHHQLETTLSSFRALQVSLPTEAGGIAETILSTALGVGRRPTPAGIPPLGGPVLVLAGGSTPDVHDDVLEWLGPLSAAVAGRGGTVVSGGTDVGVSALAPLVARAAGARSVGYLPRRLGPSAHPSTSYDLLRRTRGSTFTLREPLTYWADLLGSGIRAQDVRVLAIGGSALTALELHLALTLGAGVACSDHPVDRRTQGWRRSLREMTRDVDVLARWLDA